MRLLKKPEIQIPLTFLVISILWIVLSDELFIVIQKNITVSQVTEIQTIKGCFFVVTVTFLIHLMIKFSNKRIASSEDAYKDLFYNTPNPMLVLGLKTNKFCSVNKAALDTYGYTTKEFLEMSVEDIRAEQDGNVHVNSAAGNIFEHKKKNGQRLSCIELEREISFKNATAALLSVIDVTELEKTKSELEQREQQLNSVLNSITDGFFILGPDLVVKKANDLFKTMAAHYPGDKVEGQELLELFPGIKESGSYEQYTYAINSKSAVHFESNYKRLGKWFRVSGYPFDGGLSVFFRDITREKEDEIQRHQNEQNLLALINNTEDLMWSVDFNFKYFIFNEPYKKNYKRAFGEDVYVGKCALNEKQGKEHMQKWKGLYERALNDEKFSVNMDFVVENKSYVTTIQLNPIYDANKCIIGVGCFLRDMTESKLQMRKIEEQNEQLKRIAFITSHKVRVPLANILGLSEVLDKDDPLNPSNCQIIEHIKTSAKQLDSSIINMVQQTIRAND